MTTTRKRVLWRAHTPKGEWDVLNEMTKQDHQKIIQVRHSTPQACWFQGLLLSTSGCLWGGGGEGDEFLPSR